MNTPTPQGSLDESLKPSTELLMNGLRAIGYNCESLLIGGKQYARFTSPTGNIWLTSRTRVSYPFLSSTSKEIIVKKDLAYELAEEIGCSIPFTRAVLAEEDEKSIWNEVRKFAPLIVKPNGSTLSRGLTMNINTEAGLLEAIRIARVIDETVLIQRQVKGQEVRFAVLDGKCRSAIARVNPRLVGDGKSTLQELLDVEQKERLNLELPYTTYPKLDDSMIHLDGMDMSEVLEDGEIREIGQSFMIRHGASAYDIIDEIHPSYLEAAEKLANSLGRGFVAVDLIIEDYKQPLTSDNYVFLEFNSSPNLLVFYCCRDGRHYDILKDLVPMLDRTINGKYA